MVADGKAIDIPCPERSCRGTLTQNDIRWSLMPDQFVTWEAACLASFINADESTMHCPNQECTNVIAVANTSLPSRLGKITEEDEEGKILSESAYRHFMKNRIRCRSCQLNFCAICKSIPYHKGYDCQGWEVYKASRHCRFCGDALGPDNTYPTPLTRALMDVCTDDDCVALMNLACTKMLPCGCPCGGIRGEENCMPCLKCEEKVADDFCPICYVDSLGEGPCIKLDSCGHYVHYQCVLTKIKSGYSGARIVYNFLDCTICRKRMVHPAIAAPMAPHLAIQDHISKKAMERLVYENLTRCDKITDRKSPYYNKPQEYAEHRFLFFMCFKCKKPYFGGAYECGGAEPDVDHKSLICPGCQPKSENMKACKTHGTDWIAFKCRFCCQIANFFCWNNTHFCNNCHKPGVWQKLVEKMKGVNKKKIWEYPQCPGLTAKVNAVKRRNLRPAAFKKAMMELRSDPKKCPGGIRHPPNGYEFGLGCSMCADHDEEEANVAAHNKALAEGDNKNDNSSRNSRGKKFNYVRDMDTNGVLYYLGTTKHTRPWSNPMTANLVKVTSSKLHIDSAPRTAVVGRQALRCVTENKPNQYFIINLKTMVVRPTHYTLRHYSTWDSEALRNWRFAGSTDGVASNWDTLMEHKNDTALYGKGSSHTWTIPAQNAKTHYRFFCIIQTGRNSNNNNYLALSGFELYGDAMDG